MPPAARRPAPRRSAALALARSLAVAPSWRCFSPRPPAPAPSASRSAPRPTPACAARLPGRPVVGGRRLARVDCGDAGGRHPHRRAQPPPRARHDGATPALALPGVDAAHHDAGRLARLDVDAAGAEHQPRDPRASAPRPPALEEAPSGASASRRYELPAGTRALWFQTWCSPVNGPGWCNWPGRICSSSAASTLELEESGEPGATARARCSRRARARASSRSRSGRRTATPASAGSRSRSAAAGRDAAGRLPRRPAAAVPACAARHARRRHPRGRRRRASPAGRGDRRRGQRPHAGSRRPSLVRNQRRRGARRSERRRPPRAPVVPSPPPASPRLPARPPRRSRPIRSRAAATSATGRTRASGRGSARGSSPAGRRRTGQHDGAARGPGAHPRRSSPTRAGGRSAARRWPRCAASPAGRGRR